MQVDLEPAAHVGVDTQHLLRTSLEDPEQMVLVSPSFGPGRCSGTEILPYTLRVPDPWVVPDAGPDNPYGRTPNSNSAFLLPDGETVQQIIRVSRCVAGGPVYAPDFTRFPDNRNDESIFGNGLQGGGQGASLMSALGGTIRLGELVGDRPLRHAIKLNPWARKYLHYSDEVPGYRWPARSADVYAADPDRGYDPASQGRPSYPELVMGSLLAIPPDVERADLDLRTTPGRLLFDALRDYGAYFTEDAAWDTWDLIAERGVAEEVVDRLGVDIEDDDGDFAHDLGALVRVLWVVDDNAPESIGGAGNRIAPSAPPFE
ncbi:MAG: hypothetical protein AAF602_15470 [Myxococcota bacterium]